MGKSNRGMQMKLLINKKRVSRTLFYIVISTIICIFSTLFVYNVGLKAESRVFIISWIGNAVMLLYILTYYKIYHKIFTLFNVLVLFMFLFNWGQCLMWSIGIHVDGEIGSTNLYGNYITPSQKQILDGQVFTLFMMMFFLCGGLLIHAVDSTKKSKIRYNLATERSMLFKISRVMAVVVVPLTFYRIIQAIMTSFSYGYLALYYGDANMAGGILVQVEYLFFPVLVGLLLGSDYSKTTRKVVYAIFSLYMVMYFLAGERGNWLYKLVLLIWLDHTYHKKINIKRLARYSLVAVIMLYIVYAMVSLRSNALGGITVDQIIQAFSLQNFPIISAIFEMGGSMGIIIILLIEGSTIWTGYNTYIAAILGMPATFWLRYLGIDFQYIENWFSQDILRINWGSGFSFIGEAFLNGGLYFASVYVLVLGMFIAYITKLRSDNMDKNDVLSIAFKVTSCNAFMTMMRGSCHSSFKAWFIGALLYLGIVKILSSVVMKK